MLIERMMPHLAARLGVYDIYSLLTYLSHDYYPKFIAHLILKNTFPSFHELLNRAHALFSDDDDRWFRALPPILYETHLIDFNTFKKAIVKLGHQKQVCYI